MTPTIPHLTQISRWSSIRTAFEHSSIVRSIQTVRHSIHRTDWRQSSIAQGLLIRGKQVATGAVLAAVVGSLVRVLGGWTRTSFTYRWLTKDPEPEALVIDLRDTVTIGTIIERLDRISNFLQPAVNRSVLTRLVAARADEVRRRPVRMVSLAVFVGVVVSLSLNLIGGQLSPSELIIHTFLLSLAALGTRIKISWAEIRDSSVVRSLSAIIEPPEPGAGTVQRAGDDANEAVETNPD